ncbi:MAG: N-acetyltransferase family protein [Flavobacteriaceae bacterium]
MSGDFTLRDAQAADIEAISRIYRDAVLHGTASFELSPPDEAEMLKRFEALKAGGYPYIVAEDGGGGIGGYAYAGAYRPRPAYRFTVEDSVYVDPAMKRAGLGRMLLKVLIDKAESAGFRQMIAVIGDEASAASIGLHAALGFRHAGTLADVGYKHGAWRATVLMQRELGPGAATPPAGEDA